MIVGTTTRPGRFITTSGRRRKILAEIAALLTAHLEHGQAAPWWGAGVFTRHIVLSLTEPVSLCGRYVGDVSSQPMPTLFGVACPTCVRVWNQHIDVVNGTIAEKNEKYLADLTDEIDTLIGSADPVSLISRWSEFEHAPRTRREVCNRLDERDVDLVAALDEARPMAKAAGEHGWSWV